MKKKKELVMLVVGIFLIVAIVLGVSYAYIKYESKQEKLNVAGTECLSISLENESAPISVTKSYPIREEEGKKSKPYTFTVKNNCETVVDYNINLEALNSERRMESKYIAVYIDEEEKGILSSYKEAKLYYKDDVYEGVESHTILSGYLEPHGSQNHTLRLWIDETADNGSQNKEFLSKVVIEGTMNEVIASGGNILVNHFNANDEKITDLASTNGYAFSSTGTIVCEEEKLSCYFKLTEVADIVGTIGEICGTGAEPENCSALPEGSNIEANTWYKIKSNVQIKPKEDKTNEIIIEGKTCVGTECSEKEQYTIASRDRTAPNVEVSTITSNYQGATIPFTVADLESGLENVTCKYGLNEDDLDLEGTIENGICTLKDFAIDKTYYYAIEANDKVGNITKKTGSISSKEVVTAPSLTGGGKDFAANRTITIATPGSADTGVKAYEYYVSRSKDVPASDVTISGTGETVTITDEGTWYVYYRTVSNQGNRSSWSGSEEVNIFYKASSVGYTNADDASIKTVQDAIDVIKAKWING